MVDHLRENCKKEEKTRNDYVNCGKIFFFFFVYCEVMSLPRYLLIGLIKNWTASSYAGEDRHDFWEQVGTLEGKEAEFTRETQRRWMYSIEER